MRDDEVMEQLLRDSLAGDRPALSPGFDANLRRAVRRRRLTPVARGVLAAYALAAAGVTAWLTAGAGPAWIAGGWLTAALVAGGASAYVQYLRGGGAG